MCKTNTSLARVEKYSAVDEALNLIYLYIQEVYSPKEQLFYLIYQMMEWGLIWKHIKFHCRLR